MINITRLYANRPTSGDPLRYGEADRGSGSHRHHFRGHPTARTAAERRPVVAWNVTQRCNLHCVHCYSDSHDRNYPGELTTDEAKAVLDDLAGYGVPAVLFSGGEPLLRPDLLELAAYAVGRGLRPVLSTNGTRIDAAMARELKRIGFIYVGISLDGLREVNDRFRGCAGAFDQALAGFRACRDADQRVGLRLTLTRRNFIDLERIFDFLIAERIPRACFYHLVYSGRGQRIEGDDLTAAESRTALDIICARTRAAVADGIDLDVLTVDNHVDGPYLYLKLLREDPTRAEAVRQLLDWNGGGAWSSGVGIGNIDPRGHVHPDQFWQDHDLGDVRLRKFSDIWQNPTDPLLLGLKDRLPRLGGKCRGCRFLAMCGGAMRVRALRVFGDPWHHDPACYLTETECHP